MEFFPSPHACFACSKRSKIAAVILPSLQHLHSYSSELDYAQEEDQRLQPVVRKRPEERKKLLNVDLEREDECGICLEPCTKMVLPNCCHVMCISCFRDW